MDPDPVELNLVCPVEHSLFVKPICLPCGHTIDESALIKSIEANKVLHRGPARLTRCPLDNVHTIGELCKPAKRHINVLVMQNVDAFVRQYPHHPLSVEFLDNRRASNLVRAGELFAQGNVVEAARLGHPEAQAAMEQQQRKAQADKLVARADRVFENDRGDPKYMTLLERACSVYECDEILVKRAIAYKEGFGVEPDEGKALKRLMRTQMYQSLLPPDLRRARK